MSEGYCIIFISTFRNVEKLLSSPDVIICGWRRPDSLKDYFKFLPFAKESIFKP